MASKGKLTDAQMDILEGWIGKGPKTFSLLYAITRDGCNATTFHTKCDNQGPTVTVLYNQQGSVYGGYASASWNTSSGWMTTSDSFLYQLSFSGSPKANKFTLQQNGQQYSMHGGIDGPCFGCGNDLHTFSHSVKNSGGFFQLNGNMNTFGTNYNNQGITKDQVNNGTMNVTELEVYKVSDCQRQKPAAELLSWRKTKSWNAQFLDELTEEIVSFKPQDVKMNEVRVLMIGPVGAGKSSFYNTINSVFRGRITNRARSGCAEQSLTTTFGSTSLSFKTPGFKIEPTPNDQIHCAVFVLDSTTLDVLHANVVEKMKSVQNLIDQRGIPQLIILTKIDKLCTEVEKNISLTFKSKNVEQHVEKASHILGLPESNVLPVKNYNKEVELDENISILALLALRQILHFTEDYLENLSDRNKDLQRDMEKLKLEK